MASLHWNLRLQRGVRRPGAARAASAGARPLPGGPHEIAVRGRWQHGSTRELPERPARRDPRVKIVALSRNFGHQAAFSAAIDYATGDAVVLMDGDLQDEPEFIPELLKRHQAGADVVYARRMSRQEGVSLRFTYKLFYRLMSALAEVDLPLDSGDFALIGPPVVEALRRLPEHQRYLRGLRTWVGFKQVGVDVPRRRQVRRDTEIHDVEADEARARWDLFVLDRAAARRRPCGPRCDCRNWSVCALRHLHAESSWAPRRQDLPPRCS